MATENRPNSQPPDDPMGIGGEKRHAGYGKYEPTGEQDTQAEAGVPGAHGEPQHGMDPKNWDNSVPAGDQVADEAGVNHITDWPGEQAEVHRKSA